MTFRFAFHTLTKGTPYQGRVMYTCAHYLYTGKYEAEFYEGGDLDPGENARRERLAYECNKRIVVETLPSLGEDTKMELRKLYGMCLGSQGCTPPPKQLFC